MKPTTVSQGLIDNYDTYYRGGDSEWRRLGAIDKADNIAALCAEVAHASVLEIGAGEGSVLKELSDRGFGEDLYALEISSSGVEVIRNKRIALLRECQRFDGYHVPYADDRFDLAILTHVIEHVEHPRQLLAEARRVARHVFVEVPLEDTLRMPRDFVSDRVGHINFYSPRTIRRLLQTCELQVLEQRTSHSSRAVYAFQKGRRGIAAHLLKSAALRVAPTLAVRCFTFHSSLLCRKAGVAHAVRTSSEPR